MRKNAFTSLEYLGLTGVFGHFFETACVVIRSELVQLLDLLSIHTIPWLVRLIRFHAGFLASWELKNTDLLLLSKSICLL